MNDSRHANLKEMRFSAADGEWRVAFAFDTKRNAILLADDRFDAHLARLKEKKRK